MPVQFKIKVTKDILQASQHSGTYSEFENIGETCAIALSLIDIFPNVFVTGGFIYPYGIDSNDNSDELKMALPEPVNDFIRLFDSSSSQERLALPELEFEVNITDKIISLIDIDEVRTSAFVPHLNHR